MPWLTDVLIDKDNWCVNLQCTTCGALYLRTSLKQKLNPHQHFTRGDDVRLSHEEGLRLLDQLKMLDADYIQRVKSSYTSESQGGWDDWHAKMRFVVMVCIDSIKPDGDVIEFMQRETKGTLVGRVLNEMIAHHNAIRERYEARQREEAENRARKQARRDAHERKCKYSRRKKAKRRAWICLAKIVWASSILLTMTILLVYY